MTILRNMRMDGTIDTNNSTTVTLGIDGIFTGIATDVSKYGIIFINVYSDVDSATDGLAIQQSSDGTNWDHEDVYTVPGLTGKTYSINPFAKYVRVVYTNGAVAQTEFRLQTLIKGNSKPSSHRIQDSIVDDDDAELVKAVLAGKDGGTSYVNFTATSSGNFKVSLEELENGVSSNSNSQLNITPFHADGSEGALISGVNYVSGKSGVDSNNETILVTNYEHHEIHDGNHYNIVEVVDLPINNVRDLQITTPNTTTHAHLVFEISCESETEWYLYENVTISTAGTSITPVNNNRNSSNTSSLTIAYIDNTDVTNANADTAVAGATVLAHGITGAGQDGGDYRRDHEIILKQNEDYSIRFIANTAGFVSYRLSWYEHVAKN